MRDFERNIIPVCLADGMASAHTEFWARANSKRKKFTLKERTGRNLLPLTELDKKVSRVLESVAKEKNCKLLNVALAYILQKVPYVFSIIGGRKVDHLKGNIDSLAINLSEEDVRKVEAAYHFDHGFPHTFLSGSLLITRHRDRRMGQRMSGW